jgi:hypothetical protein
MREAHNPPKSEARLSFDMEVARLEERVAEGQCSNPVEEYLRILREHRPGMTHHERDFLQHMELRTHQDGAEMLAKHGRPVPGNDPEKPN